MRFVHSERQRWGGVPVRILAGVALAFTGCTTLPSGTVPATTQNPGGGSVGSPVPGNNGNSASNANTTLLEQLVLERVNRARLRPLAEATSFGVDLNEGLIPGTISPTPKQAVGMNSLLTSVARAHASDMLAQDYFEHVNLNGKSPFDRMSDAGFTFTVAGENLAWRGTTGEVDPVEFVEMQHTDLFVDTGIAGRGHRVTMLNGSLREVGVGVIRGEFRRNGTDFDSIMQAQDFATSTANNPLILGVVYSDANDNGQYDYGEGVANSTVSIDGATVQTNVGGGYAFQIFTPGPMTVRFSGGPAQALTVGAGDQNTKVDLVDGTNIIVNLGLGALN